MEGIGEEVTANAIKAGLAYVEVGVRDKLQAGLTKVSGSLRNFGASVSKVGAGVLGFGVAAASAFVKPVQAAAEAQAVMGKFDTVFGEQSAAVKEWGDNFAKEVGRGRTEVSRFLAGAQDLFIPLGFEPGAAEAMSKQVTSLAVDLASFNDVADGKAFEDLQAALTGSGEVMKKYGVLVNEASVKQQLLQDGIDPKNASDQQKVLARLAIIMNGTTAAQGDAVRTSGEFNNTMKRLSGELTNASESIGAALIPTLTSLVGGIADTVAKVSAWVSQNQELVVIAAKVVAGIIAFGAALTGIGIAISAAGVAFGGLASAAGLVVSAIGVVGTIVGAIATPVGLVTAAVVALGAAFLYQSGIITQASQFVMKTFEAVKETALTAFGAIADFIRAGDIQAAWKAAVTGLQLIWLQVTQKLRDVWTDTTTAILNTWNGAQLLMGQAVFGFIQTTIDNFDRLVKFISGGALSLKDSIADAFGVESVDAIFDEMNRSLEQGLTDQIAARTKAATEAKKERAERIKTLQAELKGLREQAKERRAAAEAAKKAATEAKPQPDQEAFDLASILAGLEGKGGGAKGASTFGTFSARAATQFGQGFEEPMSKVAKASEASLVESKKQTKTLQKIERKKATFS